MCLHSQTKAHLIHEYCTKTTLHQQIWDKLCCRLRFQSQNFFFKIVEDFLIKTQKAPIIRRKSDKLDNSRTKDQDTALPAGSTGSIPGWGIKGPHDAKCS